MMRAIVVERPTLNPLDLEEHEEVEIPKVLNTEHVLVKNVYAGMNFFDIYQRRGELYPVPFPFIAGNEGGGYVDRLPTGYKGELQIGDAVIYMARGSFAEYTLVKLKDTYKIDSSLLKEGTAFLMQGMTAAYLTEKTHKVMPGEWVLVPAAAGGTGALICKAAKEKGARVIGTASTTDKCDLAHDYCDFVINYTMDKEDFSKQVMKITKEKGVDVVYDGVGKATLSLSLSSLKPNGLMVSFGAASGEITTPPLGIGEKKFIEDHLFSYMRTREGFMELADLTFTPGWEEKVKIFKIYKLEETGRAEFDLENRISHGKILIKI